MDELPPLSFQAWLRWDVVARLLRRLPIESVLEIGAGQGGFGARLARGRRYVGLEPDPTSAAVARERVAAAGGTILTGTTPLLEAEERFDLVCAFEVLEHIEDDRAALDDWVRRVRPGGWLMISVPAHADRMGPQDVVVGHFRRYDRDQLLDALTRAVLTDVEITSYGFPLGYVLEAARNGVARRVMRSDTSVEERTLASGRFLQPRKRLGMLTQGATLPYRVIQRPFAGTDLGTGYVALARRPT